MERLPQSRRSIFLSREENGVKYPIKSFEVQFTVWLEFFKSLAMPSMITNRYGKTNGMKGHRGGNGYGPIRCKIANEIVNYSLKLLLQCILGWNIMFLDNFRGKILSRIGVV